MRTTLVLPSGEEKTADFDALPQVGHTIALHANERDRLPTGLFKVVLVSHVLYASGRRTPPAYGNLNQRPSEIRITLTEEDRNVA